MIYGSCTNTSIICGSYTSTFLFYGSCTKLNFFSFLWLMYITELFFFFMAHVQNWTCFWLIYEHISFVNIWLMPEDLSHLWHMNKLFSSYGSCTTLLFLWLMHNSSLLMAHAQHFSYFWLMRKSAEHYTETGRAKRVDILGPDMEGEYTEWPQGLDL
jgi:hypothetical protein